MKNLILALLLISGTQALAATNSEDCEHRIFRAVYSENAIENARSTELTLLLVNNLQCRNIKVLPTANVIAEASLHSRPAPYRWSQDTIVLHSRTDGSPCTGLSGILREIPVELQNIAVRCVPERLNPSAGGIEIWIAPRK